MKHDMRYPKHEGDKGTVFGGDCNTTACNRTGATCWNVCTYGYYCDTCARGQNWNPRESPITLPVDHDLTLEEMDARVQADMQSRYGARP